MSSAGSEGSSRISQFGLYRTIDARTEEFLRLSRKRQIKQGCVCAAISTAITVTVVVTALLIYEYNVIANARKSAHKPTWLDLMNSSADSQSLQEKFNRAKVNIDRTTLKLLPILLKALNQNRYVEKIMDEPTSLFPPYDNKDTTEIAYKKNIFADTRNWMKMPTSRLYAIEYKTSPIVYFKNPTRNIDYFTKIRKIRDYQRIMNYVDKMISENNFVGSTQPMKKMYSSTEKPPLIATIPMKKQKLTQKKMYSENEQKLLNSPNKEKMSNCKCPHKLSELINKLISSIQKLTSVFISVPKRLTPCSERVQRRPMQYFSDITTKAHLSDEKYDESESDTVKPTFVYKKLLTKNNYPHDFKSTTNFDMRKDHTLNAIVNLLKPNFAKLGSFNTKVNSYETFGTTNSYTLPTYTKALPKEVNTRPTPQMPQTANTKTTDFVTTVADYILQKGTYDIFSETSPTFTTVTESEEYVETTPNIANNCKESQDSQSLELDKTKILPEKKSDRSKDKSQMYPIKGATYKSNQHKNTIGTLRKMGNLASDIDKHAITRPLHKFVPISQPFIKPTTAKPIVTTKGVTTDFETTTAPLKRTTSKKNITKVNKSVGNENNVVKAKQEQTDDITTEDETEKAWEENISKETAIKHLEDAIKTFTNETNINKTTNAEEAHQWELVPLEENTTSPKSMIPRSRPSYLEMQRNDWKHEDDYDTNVNNYLFD